MNSKNHFITRNDSALTERINNTKNCIRSKWIKVERNRACKATSAIKSQLKYRKTFTQNNRCNLSQIAIKKKNNDSPSSMDTEVVLLNGSWDTSNKIPSIIAEMHNVNIEELQALQNSKLPEHSARLDMGHCITPRPKSSDSGIEGDCTEGNLSWLLNYRIHELPPVPDCVSSEQYQISSEPYQFNGKITSLVNSNANEVFITQNIPKRYFQQHKVQHVSAPRIKIETAVQLHNEDIMKMPGQSYRYSGPKKPPFTYTELIEHALIEKGELTVSGIYQWISNHFPFYKQNDDRWKNSVRHNLSINPHFRKGKKAAHGAGHLWMIALKGDYNTWNIKRQRIQQFIQNAASFEECTQDQVELQTATASILPETSECENINSNHSSESADDKEQNIEIEFVNVVDVTDGLGDFLCPPVPKEQVVHECGLGGDYLMTDLNPTALGLNIADAEIITGNNLYDDLNFQCYELHNE